MVLGRATARTRPVAPGGRVTKIFGHGLHIGPISCVHGPMEAQGTFSWLMGQPDTETASFEASSPPSGLGCSSPPRSSPGSREEAEDVTQGAFLKLLERWDTLDHETDVEGYLFRTALNGYRSLYRRTKLAARRVLAPGRSGTDPFEQIAEGMTTDVTGPPAALSKSRDELGHASHSRNNPDTRAHDPWCRPIQPTSRLASTLLVRRPPKRLAHRLSVQGRCVTDRQSRAGRFRSVAYSPCDSGSSSSETELMQ